MLVKYRTEQNISVLLMGAIFPSFNVLITSHRAETIKHSSKGRETIPIIPRLLLVWAGGFMIFYSLLQGPSMMLWGR